MDGETSSNLSTKAVYQGFYIYIFTLPTQQLSFPFIKLLNSLSLSPPKGRPPAIHSHLSIPPLLMGGGGAIPKYVIKGRLYKWGELINQMKKLGERQLTCLTINTWFKKLTLTNTE